VRTYARGSIFGRTARWDIDLKSFPWDVRWAPERYLPTFSAIVDGHRGCLAKTWPPISFGGGGSNWNEIEIMLL